LTIWRQEGALASICSDVEIIPVDEDEARLEPLSRVAGILGADGGENLLSMARRRSKRDLNLLDAASVKRGLNLLSAASVKRGLDLLSMASEQRRVDEKELQRRRSGGEKELRPRSAPALTSFP
jgi:hypothetical protein